ncbi:MAG: protein-glutamate O-methyltransferase CheR [Bacteroidota bacterium]
MISDEELTALMQAINNRYGLDFTNYERTSLKRGIVRLMLKNNMNSIIELWSKVLKDGDFFQGAIDDLLVNLTELFRNPDVWIKLRDDILPTFSTKTIKIWHAGCSTGEEVYTMNIVLDTLHMMSRAQLMATDLSKTALGKAQKGDYSLMTLKQYLVPFLKFFPGRNMEDYFDFHDRHANIKSKYQSNVQFKRHNLVMDSMNDKFDVILCRNVMIYFDDTLKQRVLDLLYNSLKDDGYLIIGYYDIMPDYGKTKFKIYDVKTRIYRKLNQ